MIIVSQFRSYSRWVMGASDVDAYYNHLRSTMVFPAAVLQPPFYEANRPMSMTFGAIGAVVGWMVRNFYDCCLNNARNYTFAWKKIISSAQLYEHYTYLIVN